MRVKFPTSKDDAVAVGIPCNLPALNDLIIGVTQHDFDIGRASETCSPVSW